MADERSIAELQKLKDLFHRGLIDEHEYRTHKAEVLQRLRGPSGGPAGGGDGKLAVGGVIRGRFQLTQRLGQGGFGEVWKALDRDLRRDVAIKVQIEAARDKIATERFLREMRIAAQLRHPNIVTVYDMGRTESGNLFVVTEFIRGISLHDYLSKKQIREPEMIKIAIDCLSALEEAHKTRLVHRDIKPGNIMLEDVGRDSPYVVKLIDFGLAKRGGGDTVSQHQAVSGTLPFMSPEQLRGMEPDPRMDLWSIGISMFQGLSGKLPFDHHDNAVLMQRIFNERAPDVRVVARSVSPQLSAIISKSLEKNPAHRFQSARDFRRALESLLAGGPPQTSQIQNRQPSPAPAAPAGGVFNKISKFAEEMGRGPPPAQHPPVGPPLPPKQIAPPHQGTPQQIPPEPGDGSVRPFGDDSSGQCGGGNARCSIRELSGAAGVACGTSHSLVLLQNGTVRAFGSDEHGQLGGGSVSLAIPSLADVVLVSAGGFHSLALLADGSVRAWGHNGCGQCGISSETRVSPPRPIPMMQNVVSVSCGRMHSLILLGDGSVRAFGDDLNGQLGEGSVSSPCAGIAGATAVAAGAYHSLILLGDGTIRAFGRCSEGQLGRDGVGWDDEWSPILTVPNIRTCISISAGGYHSLALLSDGTVRAFGKNDWGQTGGASTSVSVSDIFDCVAVSASGNHSLALIANGTVRAFGQNTKGQLGGGSGVSTCTAVAAGDNHSLLLLSGCKLMVPLRRQAVSPLAGRPLVGDGSPGAQRQPGPTSAIGDLLGAVNRVALNAGGAALPAGGLRIVGQLDGSAGAARNLGPLDHPPYSALPQIGTIFHRQDVEGAPADGERKTLMLC